MTLYNMKRKLSLIEGNIGEQHGVCVQEIVAALKELLSVMSDPRCEDYEKDRETLQIIEGLHNALQDFMDQMNEVVLHSKATFGKLSELRETLKRVKSLVDSKFVGI